MTDRDRVPLVHLADRLRVLLVSDDDDLAAVATQTLGHPREAVQLLRVRSIAEAGALLRPPTAKARDGLRLVRLPPDVVLLDAATCDPATWPPAELTDDPWAGRLVVLEPRPDGAAAQRFAMLQQVRTARAERAGQQRPAADAACSGAGARLLRRRGGPRATAARGEAALARMFGAPSPRGGRVGTP